jgi:predicted HicB family RNase H-like nuclease
MKYKGYEGIVSFDEEANIFHGEVINTKDVITFQGTSTKELRKAFEDSVEDYLAFCLKRGEVADKPFSGNLILRIPPELHRVLYVEAKKKGKSLNSYIEERLKDNAADKLAA